MKSAIIDPTGTYRYLLTRVHPMIAPRAILWIMLNPSTADAEVDDQTIRKICTFSGKWGFGETRVVNLFAFRSKDPDDLKLAIDRGVDPVGPDNDEIITKEVSEALTIVCAWGNHGALMDRDLHVRDLIYKAGRVPVVLGLNGRGKKGRSQPVHPLYQKNETQVSVWLR